LRSGLVDGGMDRQSPFLDSSLIRVDQLTGETVRISSSAFLSTAVALGDRSTLYAIGLFGNPASPTTQLVRYGGESFAQRSTLVEFAGEDSTADVVWDDQSGKLLTTIGYEGLQRIDGRTSSRLGSPGQIAREIAIGGLFIAAVNADGSVSVWNRATGELLFDLYVFDDSGWIAITKDGAFLASNSRLERYLDFIPDGRRRLDLNDFRVELPYTE